MHYKITIFGVRPRGKESTEVRKSQIKGIEEITCPLVISSIPGKSFHFPFP